MGMRSFVLVAAAACGNHLAPAGDCTTPDGGGAPVVETVSLQPGELQFDDLAFDPDTNHVLAAPEGVGRVFVVDADAMTVTSFATSTGVGSIDGRGGQVFLADRGTGEIVVATEADGQVVAHTPLGAGPDYVRVTPAGDEVWVTLPGDGRIDIYTVSPLVKIADISLGDPEGLTFDGAGHAYTNDGGTVVQLDVASHAISGRWSDGCGGSHGFPQADAARNVAIGGCRASGGVGAIDLTTGDTHGFEAGGGPAILAYDPTAHHLFLRGDPGNTLDILGVCADGSLATLGSAPIPERGHGAHVDASGHAWVADALGGGLVRVTDPYPVTP